MLSRVLSAIVTIVLASGAARAEGILPIEAGVYFDAAYPCSDGYTKDAKGRVTITSDAYVVYDGKGLNGLETSCKVRSVKKEGSSFRILSGCVDEEGGKYTETLVVTPMSATRFKEVRTISNDPEKRKFTAEQQKCLSLDQMPKE